jgi:tetratricopeptide (TPR) repeat protein
MNVKIYLIGLMFFLGRFLGFGQSLADIAESAHISYENKEYDKAYGLFDQLVSKSPKTIDYKFKLGICSMNYPEKKMRAIEIFEDLKKTVKNPEGAYYLGRAYHVNYQFDKAIAEFEEFIQNNKNSTKDEKRLNNEAQQYITNCKAAKILLENKVVADFKNLGAPVNTDEDEYVPSITADESIMLFTYRGKNSIGGKLNEQLQPDEEEGEYHEDVYITTMNPDSTWAAPQSVLTVNTKGNDAAISVSQDGRYMFLFQSDEKNSGDIFMSVLSGTTFSKPEPLNENVNSDAWEGSCCISADGQVLYFASERPGGYGGRDIWASVKINNDWGPAVNLGPKINTNLDDDAPFIHPDGITLFFSSKGHQSIGGYDIMFSIMKENSWTEPKSMGIPLNTTEDDRYYVINSRGDKGYFSSNRPGSGGKGKQDIYTVAPGILGEKPIVALLKGVIYGNDKPIEANIEVMKNKENKLIGPYVSNNVTGKYLMAISPGSTYRIKVYADGYEPIIEDLDIEKLDKYLEVKKDFYLYPPGPPKTDTAKTTVTPTVANTPSVTETPTVVVDTPPCTAMLLPDFAPLKGKSLNDPANYKMLLDMAGNYCAQGLVFKVQIGAYRKPQNFKYQNLVEFGKPEVNDYPDGITRFTQQQFTTINDAEQFRQKAIAKGQKDAWIVAFVNGKRYTVEELIMLDFLGKSIN